MKPYHLTFLITVALHAALCAPQGDGIVFFDDQPAPKPHEELHPQPLPHLDHLENDPSTQGQKLGRTEQALPVNEEPPPFAEDGVQQPQGDQLDNRFGIPGIFDISKNQQGELTATVAHSGVNFLGGTSSKSHSVSLGGDLRKGIKLSHSSTRTDNTGFIGHILGINGSRTKSHSNTVNAGLAGISGAHSDSQSGSVAGKFFGKDFSKSGSNSKSAAAGVGLHGAGAVFGASDGFSEAFGDGETKTGSNAWTKTFGHGATADAHQQGSAVVDGGQVGTASQAGSNAGIDLGTGFSGAQTNAGTFIRQGSVEEETAFRFPDEEQAK